jgi:2'-hydroxyisoflavone reductase
VDILLLGGPSFLGRYIIDAAVERGHGVTMFNRGRTNPELYPDVARRTGDRDGGLEALKDGEWDVVFDTTGFVPRVVGDGCDVLQGRVGHYVFVSSTGVYGDTARIGCDENARLRQLSDETTEGDTEDHVTYYGALKVLCEQVVESAFPGASTILRPGPIVGPQDPSDRFTYWVRRAAEGGRAIVPGPPDRLVQHVDVRDFIAFGFDLAEDRITGPFNAVTEPYTFQHYVETCALVAGTEIEWVWADEDWLLAQGVRAPWELPVWLPGAHNRGRLACDPSKAIAAGLRLRPFAETVTDTLAWDNARPRPLHRGAVGDRYNVMPLEAAREAELINRLETAA